MKEIRSSGTLVIDSKNEHMEIEKKRDGISIFIATSVGLASGSTAVRLDVSKDDSIAIRDYLNRLFK